MQKNIGFRKLCVVLLIMVVVLSVGGVVYYKIQKNSEIKVEKKQLTETQEKMSDLEEIIPSQIDNVFIIQDDGTFFNSDNSINTRKVAEKFYTLYPNMTDYDFLSIFTSIHFSNYIEFHDRNIDNVNGIGPNQMHIYNNLPQNLLGINYLGDTYSLANNPTESMLKKNLNLMLHETGHQWLAYMGLNEGISTGAHYSKWLNNAFLHNDKLYGDVMGGNAWQNNGDGTVSAVPMADASFFSPLSLYLMGLIPSSEVPPIEIVVPVNSNDEGYQNVKGVIKKINISDLISNYGERVPSYLDSKKDFKMAYILIVKKNENASFYNPYLNVINWIAKDFPIEWNKDTLGKSTINAQ